MPQRFHFISVLIRWYIALRRILTFNMSMVGKIGDRLVMSAMGAAYTSQDTCAVDLAFLFYIVEQIIRSWTLLGQNLLCYRRAN
jgi:hypothetical protein